MQNSYSSIKLKDAKRIKSVIKGGLNLLRGKKINKTLLGSMTLDIDDINIAQAYLKDKKNWFDRGIITKYEALFCTKNKSEYAYSFMGGRVALTACIYALGLKKGDKVLVPGFTCVVVPNAFWYEGIEVVFYDIELDTYGPCLKDLKEKQKQHPDTKAILIHHLFGVIARDYKNIIAFANEQKIPIIEDCAHSTGATLDGIPVGNLGDVAFYSSEQSKVFNTFNGGIAITNTPNLANRLKEFQEKASFPSIDRIEKLLKNISYNYFLNKYKFRWLWGFWKTLPYKDDRLHSTTKAEEAHQKPAYYGQKMPASLAAVGINQLNKIENYNHQRISNASVWEKWCDDNGFKRPMILPNSKPIYLRYPVLVTAEMKKNKVWTKKYNIQLGLWFISYLHPIEYEVTDCPNCTKAVNCLINFQTLGV